MDGEDRSVPGTRKRYAPGMMFSTSLGILLVIEVQDGWAGVFCSRTRRVLCVTRRWLVAVTGEGGRIA